MLHPHLNVLSGLKKILQKKVTTDLLFTTLKALSCNVFQRGSQNLGEILRKSPFYESSRL